MLAHGPGGFHSTIIGDSFSHSSWYRVIHKLASGGSQQYDSSEICSVLKDIASSHSYGILTDYPENLSESRHVLKVRDEFSIGGQNGLYCCIVIDMLGPNPRRMKQFHEDGLLQGSSLRAKSIFSPKELFIVVHK